MLLIPILASVSFRELPSASVGFRGLWTTISSCIVGMQTTMYLGGGRNPKLPRRYLPKIEVPSDFYPNFSFRQLPWGSVDLRLLLYRWGSDNNVCRRVMSRRPKFLSRYFPKIGVFGSAYPNFSFPQLPWASMGFRGLWTTISSCMVGMQTTMYVGGGGPEPEVPDPIFT